MTVDMDYLSNWDEYQSRYSHLKQKFLEIASLHVNGTNLENIKLFYDRDINSKRVTDEIKNLADLLKILENRSVLSYNKINVLKEIAETYIKDVVLNQIIKDYETQLQLHQTLPLFNIYKYRSGEYFSIEPINEHLSSNNNNNNANNQLEILSDHEGTNLLHIASTINYLQSTPENILNLQSNNEIKLSTFETININQNTYVSQDSSKSLLKYIVVCISVSLLVIVLIIILYFIIPYIKSPALAALTSSSAGPEPTQSTGYHQTHTVNLSYNSQPTELKTFQVSDLQAKIFHLVSDNIGRYWRDLARMLDVKEAYIDSIDIKDIPIKDKSFQTLEIFISRCLECDWEKKLIQSLNTIRRKDLAEMVQDVLLKIVEN